MTKKATATLSSSHTKRVTREELGQIPTPPATATFHPVGHLELVETLEDVLREHPLHVMIEDEEFAVRRDGSALFATFTLAYGTTGPGHKDGAPALGLRTANDRTMPIQLCAGLNVFVCDNMAFRGDLIALKRRHTSRLFLREELEGGVLRWVEHYGQLLGEVDRLKADVLTDQAAKARIYDAFERRLMPTRLLSAVGAAYFRPLHQEFEPRTAWSLHNAFTEVAKAMPLTTRVEATQALGRFFGMTNQEVS